jgi:hypothetical protein
MMGRLRSRIALRRHEKRWQLSSYGKARMPIVEFLLCVGALNAWLEPGPPDGAAKLRLAPTTASLLLRPSRADPS